MIIVSGGQTGADRGALEAAIKMGVPYRGWAPRSFKAEDGVIPDTYRNLIPCDSDDYLVRNRLNVMDSHATLLFLMSDIVTTGTKRTMEFCNLYRRPFASFNINEGEGDAKNHAIDVIEFLTEEAAFCWNQKIITNEFTGTINVAGTRESGAPGIQARTKEVMEHVIEILKKVRL
jgi:hypothetical protein